MLRHTLFFFSLLVLFQSCKTYFGNYEDINHHISIINNEVLANLDGEKVILSGKILFDSDSKPSLLLEKNNTKIKINIPLNKEGYFNVILPSGGVYNLVESSNCQILSKLSFNNGQKKSLEFKITTEITKYELLFKSKRRLKKYEEQVKSEVQCK